MGAAENSDDSGAEETSGGKRGGAAFAPIKPRWDGKRFAQAQLVFWVFCDSHSVRTRAELQPVISH